MLTQRSPLRVHFSLRGVHGAPLETEMNEGKKPSSRRRDRDRRIRARMAETGEKRSEAARHFDEIGRAKMFPKARCPRCSRGNLISDVEPTCTSCRAVWASGVDAAEEYASRVLGLNWYESITNGERRPAEDCLECGETAVVWDAFEPVAAGRRGLCFACGSASNDHCQRCSRPIMARPGDASVCRSCWQEVLAE